GAAMLALGRDPLAARRRAGEGRVLAAAHLIDPRSRVAAPREVPAVEFVGAGIGLERGHSEVFPLVGGRRRLLRPSTPTPSRTAQGSAWSRPWGRYLCGPRKDGACPPTPPRAPGFAAPREGGGSG